MKKKKNKGMSLKENFKEGVLYIQESKNFIYAVIFVFLFFALTGFFLPVPNQIQEMLLNFISDLVSKTSGMSFLDITFFIFFNNLKSSFLGLLYGAMLGIFPLITAVANGYLLGFVASESVNSQGFLILWRLFPHGIFELPALFISLGLGVKLGLWLIVEPLKFYWKNNKFISFLFILFYFPTLILSLAFNKKFSQVMRNNLINFRKNLANSLKTFLFVIVPLLIVAAIIEGGLISFLR